MKKLCSKIIELKHAFHIFSSDATFEIKFEVLKVYFLIYFKLNHPDRVKFLGKDLYFCDISSCFSLILEIFIKNEYDINLSQDTQPRILDLGSNIGLSVIYFKYKFPNSIIECYEPAKDSFEILKKNISSFGLRNVNAHNKAVGSKHGQTKFYIDNKTSASTTSSTSELVSFVECINVETIPLSSCFERKVNLMKMDIEGAESEAIYELMHSANKHNLEYLIVEYHHHHGALSIDVLSKFLYELEAAEFGYLVESTFDKRPRKYNEVTQNIKLLAYSKLSNPPG